MRGARDRDVGEAPLLLDRLFVLAVARDGNMPSSRPVTNTTGNSSPLAACTVISVTPFSRRASAGATSDTRSRKPSSVGGVPSRAVGLALVVAHRADELEQVLDAPLASSGPSAASASM